MEGAVLLDQLPGMKKADGGVILGKNGRPEFEAPFDKPGILRCYTGLEQDEWDRLPDSICRNLERSGELGLLAPRASGLGWEEVIYTPNADSTALTAAAEAIIVPDFSIPASYLTVGKILKYTIIGRQSYAATPGTTILRLRWGGVGGVVVILSGTYAPKAAASTNLTWMAEFWMQCRAVGATGSAMGAGRIEWSNYNDATVAALVANMAMRMAPPSAPAVATIDTTIDKLLSVTYTPSLATASAQTHVAILEACN